MSMMPYGPDVKEETVNKGRPLPGMSWADPFIAATLILAAVMIGCTGCVAPGCVAIVDIDLRTPEQMKASQAADCAIFTGRAELNPAQDERVLPPSVWAALFKMITDIEGRIRVGYIAWGASPAKEAANETASRGRR